MATWPVLQEIDMSNAPGILRNPEEWQRARVDLTRPLPVGMPDLQTVLSRMQLGGAPPSWKILDEDMGSPVQVTAPRLPPETPPSAPSQGRDWSKVPWDALMAAGFSMLANNQGHYGAAGPAIGKGGLAGLQVYRENQQRDLNERYRKSQMESDSALRSIQMKRYELENKKAEKEFSESDRRRAAIQQYPFKSEEDRFLAENFPDAWERVLALRNTPAKPDKKDQTVKMRVGENEQTWYHDPTGKMPGQRASWDSEYVFAGQGKANTGTTINNIPAKGEEEYTKKFGGKMAENDTGLYEAAQKAPEMAQTANTVLRILNEGKPITGFGANFRQGFASAAQAIGIKDESVADSQQLGQMLAATTMTAIKSSGLGAGNGFTNTDREFLEKAAAGQINFDEATLRRAAELNYRAATRSVEKWKSRYKMMPKSAIEATGITDEVDLPAPYAPAKVMRFDSQGNPIK